MMDDKYEGSLIRDGTIEGYLYKDGDVTGEIASNKVTLSGTLLDVTVIEQPVEEYTGSYEVTPRLYMQSLETDGKLMRDDVTVYDIPISQTTNPTGGLTVLIG